MYITHVLLVGVDNCLSSQTQSSPVTTSPRAKLRGELSLSVVTADAAIADAAMAEVTRGLGRRVSRAAFSQCQQISALTDSRSISFTRNIIPSCKLLTFKNNI